MEQVIQEIMRESTQYPLEMSLYEDWMDCVKIYVETNPKEAVLSAKELIKRTVQLTERYSLDVNALDLLYNTHKKCLLVGAQHNDFDSYLLYVEWNREAGKRFYQPRMHYLKPIVAAYQEVLDGKLDLLTVSQPKRTGKSQIGINFTNMLSGQRPDKATLMEGAGDALVDSFYKGCLEILQSSEYLHYDVFPGSKIVQTKADLKIINLANKNRFPTIMCRSIDASQVGLSEATNLIYLDDCVESRAEAKNSSLMDNKWETISGDVLGRRIQGAPIIATGTRYSISDPIGRLQDIAPEMGWRYRIVEIPALDKVTDESNFEYIRDGKRVFTTGYLQAERKLVSEEAWESEFQQEPFEAKGQLFPKSKLKRYSELPPDKTPDGIFSVCDTAEDGSDSVMMPVAYLYGDDVFIEDCVFNNGTAATTKPLCAKALIKHNVPVAVFESNNAGLYYGRDVALLVKQNGGSVTIRPKFSSSNKHTRIELASDGIIKNFYFKQESLYDRNSDYGMMMKELSAYTRTGKVKHDDAPDGMALLENEIRKLKRGSGCKVIQRPC